MTPDEELEALRRLAEDEWKFEPFGIRLEGGPHDGRTLERLNVPDIFMMPAPIEANVFWQMDETAPAAASLAPVSLYRNSGHIDDDGWCVYEFEGIA